MIIYVSVDFHHLTGGLLKNYDIDLHLVYSHEISTCLLEIVSAQFCFCHLIERIPIALCIDFLCKLVNETCAIMLVQAGMQANQLISTIDCANNITNFIENRTSKSFFFYQDSKEMCSLIFVSVNKKLHQENIPFMKTIHIVTMGTKQ